MVLTRMRASRRVVRTVAVVVAAAVSAVLLAGCNDTDADLGQRNVQAPATASVN